MKIEYHNKIHGNFVVVFDRFSSSLDFSLIPQGLHHHDEDDGHRDPDDDTNFSCNHFLFVWIFEALIIAKETTSNIMMNTES